VSILPDTSDWTWVLDRPCGDCGYDATALTGAEVAPFLGTVARTWAEVLRRPDVGVRRRVDRWSALEYGAHVRDVLRLCDARVTLMRIQNSPVFPDWDQDRTAHDADYAGQDPVVVATGLTAAADRFASDLGEVDGRDWGRPGRRSDGATFSVDSFARYVLHDLWHHLWDVDAPRPPAT